MVFKTVLFDFDGTLVDTSEGILQSLKYAFDTAGKEVPPECVLRKFIGPPLASSFQDLCGFSDDEAKKMIALFQKDYNSDGLYVSKVYDGMIETLEQLKKDGAGVGIVSLKPKKMLDRLLDHYGIGHLFSYVYGTVYDGDSDKSIVIKEAADHFGTGTSDTLMVGDRMYDIDGAHKAGFKCAGAVYGCGTKEELIEHNADFLLDSPQDLLPIVMNGTDGKM